VPVEERRRAGDDQPQAGETALVDVVDELAQRLQALVPGVGAHALHRLDLVEDDQEPAEAGVTQHDQQPGQER
jgi:hypothetical protein